MRQVPPYIASHTSARLRHQGIVASHISARLRHQGIVASHICEITSPRDCCVSHICEVTSPRDCCVSHICEVTLPRDSCVSHLRDNVTNRLWCRALASAELALVDCFQQTTEGSWLHQRLFSTRHRPDRLWGSPSFLSNGCRRAFPRGWGRLVVSWPHSAGVKRWSSIESLAHDSGRTLVCAEYGYPKGSPDTNS
jgi:hypothetical protein